MGKEYVDSIIVGIDAATRLVSTGTLMVFGFIKGLQPIAGFSYGAKQYDRLNAAIKTSVIWSFVFCTVFGVAATLLSTNIISVFTTGTPSWLRLVEKRFSQTGCPLLSLAF